MGGLLWPPFFVADRDEPYRVGLIAWVDVSSGLVVGQDVVAPEETAGAVGRALLAAIEQPLAGPGERPDRIRVAVPELADEVRAALGDDTPVVVAPTPELDELLETMVETLDEDGNGDWSYLEADLLAAERVGQLFVEAKRLYKRAPWKVVTDEVPIRMDIPALGVEGACVIITGSQGIERSVLVFPSLDALDAFAAVSGTLDAGHAPSDLGTDWLALSFERGADLPPALRREVEKHRWPVASANAYPAAQRFERDGACPPLSARDLEIVTACATALGTFVQRNRSVFRADVYDDPVCATICIEERLEVTMTAPYEAYGEFELSAPMREEAKGTHVGGRRSTAATTRSTVLPTSDDSRATPVARPGQGAVAAPADAARGARVGRNDPCPCGSGRKYKKCHLAEDRARHEAVVGVAQQAARAHAMDEELLHRIGRYARDHVGGAALGFQNDFADLDEAIQLAIPWSAYHFEVEGRPLVDWFLEARGRRLSRAERAWLDAQRAAWLSVWEVVDVVPGQRIALRDLLSGEERTVHEEGGSESLVAGDAVLARIVDYEGLSLLCGVHTRILPPIAAAEVERRARGRLRRKRDVPVDRLRDESFGRYLIKRWDEAVEALFDQAAHPPELRNTEGHALLQTKDHFALESGASAAVAARLARMDDVEVDEPEEPGGPLSFVFVRVDDAATSGLRSTVVGEARLAGEQLEVETNSIERADALRTRIEAACEGLLRHRAREHADPLSAPARAAAREPIAALEDGVLPPGAEQLVLDYKRRHYATWPDEPLPALQGRTPREAVRTADGRREVDVLLKDMQNRERRAEGANAFDFGELRRELGLGG